MRIIVTGATGFLGKSLQVAFKPYQEQLHNIWFFGSKDYDLLNRDHVYAMIRDYVPDVIVHAAAVCGGIKANSKRPADFLTQNLQMGINIFEALTEYYTDYNGYANESLKSKKIYTLGTVCSYPINCPTPFKEDDIWNGYPEPTNAPYSMAKRALMEMGKAYRAQYGIGGVHLIPVNLFGNHDHFDLENSHVIPALINKFVDAVENNKEEVTCWGTGTATREFLYAEDAAEAIARAVMTGLDTDLPINLGTGVDISIKDLAYLIAELTGFQDQIRFTGEVSDGQPKRRLDVSRAKELLDWTAKTSLREGLIKTIEWYKENK